MISHTKGPWKEWDAEIEGSDGSKIGQLYSRPEDEGTWGSGVAEANSRLVCAAPDLLAVVKNLLDTVWACRGCEWDMQPHEYVQLFTDLEASAKKALAKAQYQGPGEEA
tara:strand:- start:319 stop:645 length:327 start_codon:yes stop_codon:yes gene_type:complete